MGVIKRMKLLRAAIREALVRIEAKKARDEEDLRLIEDLKRQIEGKKTARELSEHLITKADEKLNEVWKAGGVFAQSEWSRPSYVKGKALEFMRIYNDSLAALVEGQRETLHNDDFVFEDGESVKAKEEKFRRFIESSTGSR